MLLKVFAGRVDCAQRSLDNSRFNQAAVVIKHVVLAKVVITKRWHQARFVAMGDSQRCPNSGHETARFT